MKTNLPFYPFLFAIYPILTMYSRNPGEIHAAEVVRPIFGILVLTGLVLVAFQLLARDWRKAAFITALAVLYYSSSGHVYRIVKDNLHVDAGPWLHLGLLLVETLLILLVASPGIWDKYFTPARVEAGGRYLNLVSLLTLVFPAVLLGGFWIETRDDSRVAWSRLIGRQDVEQSLNTTRGTPDIYYVLVDGYGREDVLDSLYHLDTSAFIDALESRGFYVADHSRSNYVQTPLSFSSFLNFDYVNFAEDLAGPDSVDRLPLFDLIQHSRAARLLRDGGYKLVTTSTGFQFTEMLDADVYLSPFKTRTFGIERFFLSTTALSVLYDFDTPISGTLRDYLPLPSYGTHRERILFSLDQLEHAIPAIPGPKFVFVHIVAPHPPFVLDRAGNPVEPDRPYVPGDGEAFLGTPEEYQASYAAQVTFLNTRLIGIVDGILAASPQPPIIVIHGDHGPGSLLRRDSLENTCIWERTSILNAYLFPEQKTGQLYPHITPVNTFRAIFDTFFGTNYSMLPDRTYYSPQSFPYRFVDVTAPASDSCAGVTPTP